MYFVLIFRSSCAIPGDGYVLVTGGFDQESKHKVTKYDRSGYVENIADLKQGRHLHGCSFFMKNDEKVISQIYLLNKHCKGVCELLKVGLRNIVIYNLSNLYLYLNI